VGETKGTAVKDKTKKGTVTYTAPVQIEYVLGLDGIFSVEARDAQGVKLGELRIES
jgi:hypothetical protein